MTIAVVLLLAALICFLLSAFGANFPRVNLEALGLAFVAIYMLVGNLG